MPGADDNCPMVITKLQSKDFVPGQLYRMRGMVQTIRYIKETDWPTFAPTNPCPGRSTRNPRLDRPTRNHEEGVRPKHLATIIEIT